MHSLLLLIPPIDTLWVSKLSSSDNTAIDIKGSTSPLETKSYALQPSTPQQPSKNSNNEYLPAASTATTQPDDSFSQHDNYLSYEENNNEFSSNLEENFDDITISSIID